MYYIISFLETVAMNHSPLPCHLLVSNWSLSWCLCTKRGSELLPLINAYIFSFASPAFCYRTCQSHHGKYSDDYFISSTVYTLAGMAICFFAWLYVLEGRAWSSLYILFIIFKVCYDIVCNVTFIVYLFMCHWPITMNFLLYCMQLDSKVIFIFSYLTFSYLILF